MSELWDFIAPGEEEKPPQKYKGKHAKANRPEHVPRHAKPKRHWLQWRSRKEKE